MKKIFRVLLLAVGVPAVVIGGTVLFSDKAHVWLSLCVAVLTSVPFFWRFERRPLSVGRRQATAELVCVAVLTALAVAGRFLFAALPSFKPVTAIVVLAGMYFGAEDGFLVGALTALISNFYFGQGLWTPYQMMAWGLVGLLAGLLAKPLKKHWWLLLPFGALTGVMYSVLMDLLTVLWMGQGFSLARYAAAITASLPVTGMYMLSDAVFLLVLHYPVGRTLTRARMRYGMDVPDTESDKTAG